MIQQPNQPSSHLADPDHDGPRSVLTKLISGRVGRWLLVGALFAAVGLGFLQVLAGVLAWPYWVATLCQGEICTVLRFLVVDRWVFDHHHPTWRRLLQYHIANGVSFAIWWSTANILQTIGVHYLLAAILAMGVSVGVSLLSNFLWIWRKPAPQPQ
jgi:putative flippase GtrA